MKKIKSPIGCFTFLHDGHKIEIIEENKNNFIGKCIHGDIFELSLDCKLYEEVEYRKETK